MEPIDLLNKYTPYTYGYVFMADRYRCWWQPGIILGRTMGFRRVELLVSEPIKGQKPVDYVFIQNEQQFQLTCPWYGTRLYKPFRI